MKYIKHTKIFTTSVLFIFVYSFSLNAQWNITEDVLNMEMPDDASYKTVKLGKDLYMLNCASCHGTPGEGNNIAAIKATDLGTLDFQNSNTPGSVFYKIKEGMGAMPSFKDKLNDDEKWNIVHYIKSFDKKFLITGEKIQSYKGTIDLKSDDDTKKLFANISVKDKDNNAIANESVEVVFFVERIFGDLPIGDPVATDDLGTASIEFPDHIPGDDKGKVKILASFKDTDMYGNNSDSLELNWGEPVHYEDPTKERTLWGFGHRVPLWLLFTYIFITGTVWLGIFYVIFNLLKLKKAGK